jgi:hypothetical protein
VKAHVLVFAASVIFSTGVMAGTGDWPEPRQNNHLTGIQPLAGKMADSPKAVAEFDVGRTQTMLTYAYLPDNTPLGLSIWAGALYCYDRDGSQRWMCHPAGLNFQSVKSTGDLDGDGSVEIVLDAGRPAAPFGAAVMVSLEDGKLIWRYDVEPMSYAWYLYVDNYLPDIAAKQIVVIMHAYPPDPKFGYIALFEFPMAGKPPVQRWRYDFDAYTCFPSFLQSDLDGDGKRELVVETHSRMWFLDVPTGRVKQFYSWDVSPGNIRSYGLVKFADLNGDKRDDFLCIGNFAQHHEVLLNENGKMKEAWHYGWPESVTTGKIATAWAEPPNVDVDGDGKPEIVLSMFNSEDENAWLLRVYDAISGKLKYRMPGVLATSCADVDGDGIGEILLNACDDPTKTVTKGARLYRIKEGQFTEIWRDDSATANLPASRSGMKKRAGEVSPRITKDGQDFALDTDDQGKVIVQSWSQPAQENKPQFSDHPAVAGTSVTDLLAADLVGDSKNELIVYQNPKVSVLSLEGGKWIVSKEYNSSGLPAVADFNGDNKNELVLAHTKADAMPRLEAITPSTDATVWDSTLPPPDRNGLPHSRAAYLRTGRFTGKPTPDIFAWIGTPIGRSVAVDGLTGKVIWEKGEMPNKKLERYWGPTMNHAATFDFNGDGNEELIFTNPDYYCVSDGPTGDLLHGPAFPPEVFKQPSMGLYTFPAILSEPTGEPTVALIDGHYFQGAMSLHSKPKWYATPAPGENRSACEGFLRLDDGTWLLGFGRQNGNFACINVSDGSVRWELPVDASCTDTVTCDVDGDREYEFVFGTSHGNVVAVGDGGATPRVVWSAETGAGCGPIIAADIDGDGKSEIIVALTNGKIVAFG